MNIVHLSRRNLQTLLNKLDRNKKGVTASQCTIIKADTFHSKYPCSDVTAVVAVEDSDYYAERKPGVVLDAPEEEES